MPPGLRLGDHAHGSDQLVFVLEGSYAERWPAGPVRLRPGSVIFRPAGERHANAFDRGGVLALVVAYRAERNPALSGCRGPVELPGLLADLRSQVELELRRDDPSSAVALEGLGLLLAARVGRFAAPRERPVWLADAMCFIERHHAESIGLSAVAGAVEQHRGTVAAAFRRHVGRSVGETIRAVQVRSAVDRIRRSRASLAEIAVASGFYDQAHMGRVVKRLTGWTPGDIRRRTGRR